LAAKRSLGERKEKSPWDMTTIKVMEKAVMVEDVDVEGSSTSRRATRHLKLSSTHMEVVKWPDCHLCHCKRAHHFICAENLPLWKGHCRIIERSQETRSKTTTTHTTTVY